MHVYYGVLAIAYLLLAFIRSGGFGPTSIINDASNAFGLLPALLGGYLFASVYTDDLGSGVLASLVGHGVGRVRIVLAKAASMACLSALSFSLAVLWLAGCHALLGWPPTAGAMQAVAMIAVQQMLLAVGSATLASVAVYGLGRPTFAMVTYVMIALNVIGGAVQAILTLVVSGEVAKAVGGRMIHGIADRMLLAALGGGQLLQPTVEYVAYVALSCAAAAAAFLAKEVEFKP
jgi:hypothetical protein